MKKSSKQLIKMATASFFVACLLSFTVSCSDDDDAGVPIEAPTIANLSFALAENPMANASIGNVQATDPQGLDLAYSLSTQSVANAIVINSTTGEISVNTVEAFDYEVNTSISADVVVTNGTESATETIQILIDDLKPSTQGLAAHYKNDAIVNNICEDASTNGLDAFFQNGNLPNIVTGVDGNAYDFAGTSSNINVASNAIANQISYSFAFWVNVNSSGYVIAKGPTNDMNIGLQLIETDGTDFAFNLEYDSTTTQNIDAMETNISIAPNVWTHVSIVCDNGTNWKTYLNGVLEDQTTTTEANVWNNTILHLGGYGSASFLGGALDDIYIYQRALSAEDVFILFKE
ncbi:hypothetical protein Q2T40_09275 [Winogradskyella maritima]|uniref:LamG-like jellyroll fold domain-containing protein n=1 Tax=Winogradskyella maritima TaxID=1517766 RepID=A0ABV8AIZ4_9FLAO|nr:hypothetical protein [Winogradskyella maritima]